MIVAGFQFVDWLLIVWSVKIGQIAIRLTHNLGGLIKINGRSVFISIEQTILRLAKEFFHLDLIIIFQAQYPQLVVLLIILFKIRCNYLWVDLFWKVSLAHGYWAQVVIEHIHVGTSRQDNVSFVHQHSWNRSIDGHLFLKNYLELFATVLRLV